MGLMYPFIQSITLFSPRWVKSPWKLLFLMEFHASHLNLSNHSLSDQWYRVIYFPLEHSCLWFKNLFLPPTANTKPVITTTDKDHLVLELNQAFELHCQGDSEIQWAREERPNVKLRGERKMNGSTMLHITKALPSHMGRYVCLEKSSGEQASIYIYIRGMLSSLCCGVNCVAPCGRTTK